VVFGAEQGEVIMTKRVVVIAALALVGGLASAPGTAAERPKPIDYPIVRPHEDYANKTGKHVAPGKKKDRPGYGAQWKQIFKLPPMRPLSPSLRH
jgi:hypothetical protein